MIYLLCSIALADSTPYLLPITRNNVTHKMVAAPWWGGEYPMPIVDVFSPTEKMVTIQGYESLRVLKEPKKACTISVGLYHPWTKNKIVENFYTITGSVSYEVLADIPDYGWKKGDILENEVYLGENQCGYTWKSGKTKKDESYTCVGGNESQFKKVTIPSHPEEQWLYLKCQEGYKVFIQDIDLLQQTGDRVGQICGYGMVVTHNETCPE